MKAISPKVLLTAQLVLLGAITAASVSNWNLRASITDKQTASAYACGAVDAAWDMMLDHPAMWPAAVRPEPLPHCVEARRLAVEQGMTPIGRERSAALGLRLVRLVSP